MASNTAPITLHVISIYAKVTSEAMQTMHILEAYIANSTRLDHAAKSDQALQWQAHKGTYAQAGNPYVKLDISGYQAL